MKKKYELPISTEDIWATGNIVTVNNMNVLEEGVFDLIDNMIYLVSCYNSYLAKNSEYNDNKLLMYDVMEKNRVLVEEIKSKTELEKQFVDKHMLMYNMSVNAIDKLPSLITQLDGILSTDIHSMNYIENNIIYSTENIVMQMASYSQSDNSIDGYDAQLFMKGNKISIKKIELMGKWSWLNSSSKEYKPMIKLFYVLRPVRDIYHHYSNGDSVKISSDGWLCFRWKGLGAINGSIIIDPFVYDLA